MSKKKDKRETKDDLQEIMESGGWRRSPLFWGALILIPIALALFSSAQKAQKENPAAVKAEIREEAAPGPQGRPYTGRRHIDGNPGGSRKRAR